MKFETIVDHQKKRVTICRADGTVALVPLVIFNLLRAELDKTDAEIFNMTVKERFLAFCEWEGVCGTLGETLWTLAHA